METQKSYINIIIAFFFLLFLSACDDILDKTPPDRLSEVVLWQDINLVDKYLIDCYNASMYGGFNSISIAALTDEAHDTHNFGARVYTQGNMTADRMPSMGGDIYWDRIYSNIQIINVFIDNIDKVPGAYPTAEQTEIKARTDVMKGEAYFLRAQCYTYLARNWGGVVINTKPFKLGDDYLSIQRSTFKKTVDFIVGQCDTAANLLGNKSDMEMGRATKEAALTIKSRILLFAASDLTADGTAANEMVGYQNPDRTALWTAAKNAAKAVIDMGTCSLENFGEPDKAAVAQGFHNLFKTKDLSSNEVIWGRMWRKDAGEPNFIDIFNGPNGFVYYGLNAPTGNLADAFQMEDGTEFSNHFQLDNNKNYKNISSKYSDKNIYHNREPRFYGTILYDGAVWAKRLPELQSRDPLGIYERRTRITISGGVEVSKIFGIDTRQGPVDPEDGTYTGYNFKKFLDDQNTASEVSEQSWIEMRYAEILLNYAEACLELNQIAEATTYINLIRNRAGMPNFTGDITKALRYERQVEFVYEKLRWYDMRRWKILDQVLTNAYGVDITEINNMDNNTVTTTWHQIGIENRGPVTQKMYWLPIRTTELKRAPQLLQNPGY